MLKYCVCMLTMLCFTSVVQAESLQHRQGSFLGVGMASFQLDYQESLPAFGQTNRLTGLYMYTGVDFNPFFGSEVRFGFSNKVTTSYPNGTLAFSVDAFTAYLFRLSWDEGTQWRVTALLGYTDAQIARVSTLAGINDKASARGISYGAAFSYVMSDTFHVDVEYLSYWNNVDTGSGTKMSLTNLALRLGYNF